MSCCVKNCKSRGGKTDEVITFHRFPRYEVIRRKWLNLIGSSEWCYNPSNRICLKHFTDQCFVPKDEVKRRRLTKNAFPTLYLTKTITLETPSSTESCETSDAFEDSPNFHISRVYSLENKKEIESPLPMEFWETQSPAQSAEDNESTADQQNLVKTENESPITNVCKVEPDEPPEYVIGGEEPQQDESETESPLPTEFWKTQSAEDNESTANQQNVVKTENESPITNICKVEPDEPPEYVIGGGEPQQDESETESETESTSYSSIIGVHSHPQRNVIEIKPYFKLTQPSGISTECACGHEEIIKSLHQQLLKAKDVSERRRIKIATLEIKNSRLLKRTSELYSIINGDIDLRTIP